jgi:L-seryl-tRNA(Ser) seleniumtransferase
LQKPEVIRERAKRIAKRLKREIKDVQITVMADTSRAGGGSLPELDFPTYVVAIRSDNVSVNEFEERLRNGNPPIIARIKEGSMIIDARTIRTQDFNDLIKGIKSALSI